MQEHNFEKGSMDLYDIFDVLWNRKWWFCAIVSVALIASLTFVLVPSRNYVALMDVQAVMHSSVPELGRHTDSGLLAKTTGKSMLLRFIRLANEGEVKRNAFKRTRLVEPTGIESPKVDEWIENYLNRNVTVEYRVSQESKFVGSKEDELTGLMSVSGPNRAMVSEFLETWVSESGLKFRTLLEEEMKDRLHAMEQKNTQGIEIVQQDINLARDKHLKSLNDEEIQIDVEISRLRSEYSRTIEDEIIEIDLQIDELKKKTQLDIGDDIFRTKLDVELAKSRYEVEKYDQILFLEEQLDISKQLGIEDFVDLKGWERPIQVNSSGTQISEVSDPYFFLGSTAINKQIQQLKERQVDDSFIPELRSLEIKIEKALGMKDTDAYVPGLRELEKEQAILLEKVAKDEYIAGLRSLESRRENLSKQKLDSFVPNIRELELELEKLKTNVALSNAKKLYEESDIRSGKVALFEYDLKAMNVSANQKSPAIILGVGGVAGILLAVLGVIFLDGYLSRKTPNGG